MNLKKILCEVVCTGMVVMSFNAATVFAQENVNDAAPADTIGIAPQDTGILMEVGEVEKAEDGTLTVNSKDGNYSAYITAETIVVPERTKNIVTADDITVGSTIKVYSEIATKSIPAILNADKVVIVNQVFEDEQPKEEEENNGIVLEVASVEKSEDGHITVFGKDGMYAATISEDTEVVPEKTKNIVKMSDITVGSKIRVFSETATMSIPAYLNAEKVIILEAADISQSSEISVTINGKSANVNVVVENNTVMLPVREISEAMGLEVGWNDVVNAVSIGTIPMGVNFVLDVNSYNKARMTPFTLASAPKLIDDKTYVPAEFFSEILEAEVSTADDGIAITYNVK